MGMDVQGIEPSAPEGRYFGRNTSGWRPLADFIIETQPDIAGKLIGWNDFSPDGLAISFLGTRGWYYYNSGDGLDAEGSVELADALDKMLVNGEAVAYIKARNLRLKQLPNETCNVCHGTGILTQDTAKEGGFRHHGETGCSRCRGRGWQPNSETHYYLRLEDIQ